MSTYVSHDKRSVVSRWRKSSRSAENGACVEAGLLVTSVATRDSKFPQGGTLVMSRDDWRGFLSSVQS